MVLVRRPPHRTDCCRPIRRRRGVKGRFACTLTRHFDLCSLPCGQIGPLMPHRRRITIRRQSGGGLCTFRLHAERPISPTWTISLGIGPIMLDEAADQPTSETRSSRDWPRPALAIARSLHDDLAR